MSQAMAGQEDDFSTGSASASLTTPAQASSLRKGGFVLLGGTHPCKIADVSTSKPGKHGHAKVKLVGYDIFTHQKYEDVSPAHAVVEVPVLTRNEFMLLDIDHDDGFLSLFVKENGETREDLKVPEGDVGEKLLKGLGKKGQDVIVIVLAAMGQEIVIDVKEVDRE